MTKYLYHIIYIAILLFGVGVISLHADIYDAEVTTDSGIYTVPVEVEDGEVSKVYWPNGGAMTVTDADLEDNEADGTNLRGDSIHIELEDSPSQSDDEPEGDND